MGRAARHIALRRRATVDGAEIEGELQPLASYVLVKPRDTTETTKGGIVLPGKADKPPEGTVLAVGPGEFDEDKGSRTPVWAEAGMKVLYGKYGAEKVSLGGDEERVLVRGEDVLLAYSGDEPTLESIQMPPGKVLIRLREETKETAGGLILSLGAAKADTTLGDVAAVGAGLPNAKGEVVPLDLDVGDIVKFRYGSEVQLEVDNAEFRVVDVEDCLAKWRA